MMLPDIQAIPLNSIDREDRRFRVSTQAEPEALATSMRKVGLIHPPILIPKGPTFTIVSGFARVAAATLLGWGSIPGHILAENLSFAACVQLAIADNVTIRRLNPVEQSRCTVLLSTVSEDIHQIAELACSAGLKVNAALVQKLLAVSRMDSLLLQGLIGQSIALPVALEIHAMRDPEIVHAVAALLIELNLSLNRQREVVDWLVALSATEAKSIADILKEEPIANLRNDTRMDSRQKSAAIRRCLKRRRYPTISRAEEHYHRQLKSVSFPDGVRLDHPPYFEGSTYCLRVDFETLEGLEKAQKQVERLIQSPEFRQLLNMNNLTKSRRMPR